MAAIAQCRRPYIVDDLVAAALARCSDHKILFFKVAEGSDGERGRTHTKAWNAARTFPPVFPHFSRFSVPLGALSRHFSTTNRQP
jgi:hypothetical protein